ncbi:MAG: patatin-like phospholipase family protein, partial [Gammaproteobacteria bacterium]|nr:patatin-like phospholipase family protein [Gammaproteobacteria bacterium]
MMLRQGPARRQAGRGPLIGLVASLVTALASGQQTLAPAATPAPDGKRPRVGLALAGGGARGGAHIGVLKVLEELHVPIDCIAGTSMGALVGGGYASGMRAAEIEQFVTHVDWKSVVGGVGSRDLLPAEQKRFNDTSGSVELGLKNGRIIPPSGLIASSRIEDVLRAYVAQARAVADFDRLPIPYRAVATDMLTGNMVVIGRGDIAGAMRASMAIPGAFAPVVTSQYVLADGFIVRNLPIDVARNLCADVVIAVNLAKPTAPREQLIGPASLVSRSNDIMMEANERAQLETLTARDVRIDVELGDFSAADFERTAETIPLGEQAARAMAARLASLSVTPAEYAAWRNRVTVSQKVEIRVAGVEFRGLKYVNPEYLRSLTRVRAGDTVDISAISRDAARLAVLDDLETVEYHLEGDPDNPVLVWEPRERQIGPNVLRPSMGIYAAGGGELRFELELQYVRRWLNDYGGQWRNRVQLGTSTSFLTSLYQPLDTAQIFFIEPGALASRSIEDIYNDYRRIAQYFFIDFGGRIDAGVNLGSNAQLRGGYFADRRRVEVDTGSSLLPTGKYTDAGLVASGFFDNRDASTFATRGTAAQIQYFRSDTGLGASRSWETLEAGARHVLRAGVTTLWLTAAGGSNLGSALPADRAFSLGGPQSFPGYSPGEVRAERYWTVQGNVLWRVADILPIANQALYGGFGVEGGHVYERVDPVPDGELYGVSGYIGGRTPLGTITLGVG